ncbi:MAG: Type secretion system protein [Thermodesulfobacteriota bacterium]|nr:Type secretion system protein [Thermodesulfobacteriota bacterium]
MKRPHINNQKGIALVLILWVLALLSVIAGEFCYAMRTEVNITRNFKEQSEAYYLALAGLNKAIGELIRNQVILQKTKLFDDKTKREEKRGGAAPDGGNEDSARWRINVNIPPVPFGAGTFEVKIGNEVGKININQANEGLLKIMVDAFDLEDQQKVIIVDSILDWRDKDNLHRLNGAENEYYNSLPEPYECKNGDFDSEEELLLVRGVTPEMYYGGLQDMVTVFLDKRAIRKSTGDILQGRSGYVFGNRICINAASEKMLRALPSMTDELVQKIINYRKEKDFKLLDELSPVVGPDVYKDMSPYITVEESAYYTISSRGLIPGGRIHKGIEAMVEVSPTIKRGWRVVQWRDGLRR